MPITSNLKETRNEDGTFKGGISGNPNGRPLGSKNKITLLRQSLELQLREQAAPDMAGVMKKAIEMALDGDRTMIKLLLEQHLAKAHSDEIGKSTERPQINITGVSKVEVTSPPSPAESPSSGDLPETPPSSPSTDLI